MDLSVAQRGIGEDWTQHLTPLVNCSTAIKTRS